MKNKRHNKILELIRDTEVGTQEELLELLRNDGYDVTQATISREVCEILHQLKAFFSYPQYIAGCSSAFYVSFYFIYINCICSGGTINY